MNPETTKAMQEALQAAVARMNAGGTGDGRPPMADLIATAVAVLPKLMQSFGASEEVLQRLDAIRKTDMTGLREELQAIRKQNHRLFKFQEEILVKVHEIQRQQVAAAGAVLDLAQQMARITFLDATVSDDGDDGGLEAPPAPSARDRGGLRESPRAGRNGGSRRMTETDYGPEAARRLR
jgi:hypothetical protein